MDSVYIDKKELKKTPYLNNYDEVNKDFSYSRYTADLKWFDKDHINAAYNAVTRQAEGMNKDKIALFWEGDGGEKKKYTFAEIEALSNQVAHYLVSLGVQKSDRIFLFLPRIPELYIAFIAILKIGAVAGTLFSAFGPQALFDRLDQSEAKILLTHSTLAGRLESIRKDLAHLSHVVVVDQELEEGIKDKSTSFDSLKTHKDDPAFMLYTSGTTGKPKGVVHHHEAIVHQYLTTRFILDIHEDDIYWCTADPGWVTGIAYSILGSWANGSTTVVYAGRFSSDTWYRLLQEYKVTIWYTAPTAIRMLASEGLEKVTQYDLSHLRHLASVGEPLNPEPIYWGMKAFGLPFHDNYWQTETGGIMVANYPCLAIKPGSMGKPFPGIKAHVVDDEGHELPTGKIGNLVFEPGWPSMMKEIFKQSEKYASYFKHGYYVTGDLAYRDNDGYFWFVGRADDVIKTSGERVGPFEVESALVSHSAVVEAGVIGKPDQLRGEIIKAFVVLKQDITPSDQLKEELTQHVKKNLAGHAYPREIEFIDKLPKTRSGKIMRRILKAKELGLPIGDTSTLEEY